MSDTSAKLVRMINQIAQNLATDRAPAGAVADHVHAFWTPRMIGQLLRHAGETGELALHPIASSALGLLAQRFIPAPHGHATDPHHQGPDGG